MWFGDEAEAARLEGQGHEQLEAGAPQEALKTAERLLAMGWSGGFVLAALAHAGSGDREQAVTTLESGVQRAPAAWRLWHLLGNLRSDLERFDAAIEAFDRGLALEDGPKVPMHFNRAIANRRAGRFGDALADLEPILTLPKPPAEIAEAALALTLECLAEIGRGDDARAMIEDALERCEADDPRRPRLEAERALALDRCGAAPEEVTEAFTRATDGGVASQPLITLGRRLFVAQTDGPVDRLQLVVQGAAPPDTKAGGFLRVFDIVASSPEGALELARRYVPAHAREQLAIERCDVREPQVELEPGVYGASELMLFA